MMTLEQYLLSKCKSLYELKVGLCLLKGTRHQKAISDETGISKRNVYRALAMLKHYVVSPKTPIGVSPDTSAHNVVSHETPEVSPQTPEVVSPQTPYNVVSHQTPGVSPDTPIHNVVSPETPGGVSHQTPHNISNIRMNIHSYRREEEEEEYSKNPKKDSSRVTPAFRDKVSPQTPHNAEPAAGTPPSNKRKSVGIPWDRYARPERDECMEFFAAHGSSIEEGAKFFNWYEARDWMSGKTRIAFWRMQAKIWISDHLDRAKPSMNGRQKEPWQIQKDEAFVASKQAERWGLINSRKLTDRITGKLESSDLTAIGKIMEIQEVLDRMGAKYDFKITKQGGRYVASKN
jgi:hypothetical protein